MEDNVLRTCLVLGVLCNKLDQLLFELVDIFIFYKI